MQFEAWMSTWYFGIPNETDEHDFLERMEHQKSSQKMKKNLFRNCYQETGVERLHLKILEQQLAINPGKHVALAMRFPDRRILSLFANVDE